MSNVDRRAINATIESLENAGIQANQHRKNTKGLGDLIESTLNSIGITESRFKEFFGLRECDCTKRKQWLNGVLSWYVEDHPNSERQIKE